MEKLFDIFLELVHNFIIISGITGNVFGVY